MAVEIEFAGRRPAVAAGAWVAPTAVLIDEVSVAEGASVWYGAVLRADYAPILVGAGSNVQDNCVLHTADGLPTVLEEEVTVGHLATMDRCLIERGVLAAGAPAKVKRELSGAAQAWGDMAAGEYQRLWARYLAEARTLTDGRISPGLDRKQGATAQP